MMLEKRKLHALLAGDAMMDGTQGAFTSSVDNVYQQSLTADMDQAPDWQVVTVLQ